MTVRLANDEDRVSWDEYVAGNEQGSFMQSWAWGDMQKEFGLPITRLVVEEGDKILGVALLIEREVSFGRCWVYSPRGPVFSLDPKVWRLLNDKISEVGESKKAIFMRCDPLVVASNGNDVLFRQGGWQSSERQVQPQHTLLVNLKQDEEQIMAAMHQKTRYNIRLAEKKGVKVRFSKEASDIDLFIKLAKEIEDRGSFHFHPDRYYKVMQQVLSSFDMFEIAVAQSGSDVLAVHLLVGFGDTVTYVHGASSNKKREVMAPHLLQWESMKRAKQQGYAQFDFFGVAPKQDGQVDKAHPWAGITRFKTGFGGEGVAYIGAYDKVLDSAFYTIYNVARRMKGAVR